MKVHAPAVAAVDRCSGMSLRELTHQYERAPSHAHTAELLASCPWPAHCLALVRQQFHSRRPLAVSRQRISSTIWDFFSRSKQEVRWRVPLGRQAGMFRLPSSIGIFKGMSAASTAGTSAARSANRRPSALRRCGNGRGPASLSLPACKATGPWPELQG